MSRTARVRYKGPGGEVFPELNWAPKSGEVREIEIVEDAIFDDHPTLEETTDPLTPQTETEIAAGTADDPDDDEGGEDEQASRGK